MTGAIRGGAAAVAVALLATMWTGCAADDPAGAPSGADPAAGVVLADAGLSVAEALRVEGGGVVVVRAHLFVEPGGAAALCDLVRESHPPRCGGARMAVTGLPPELVAGLAADSGRRRSDGPVQLAGTVRDGVLVNDPAALAAG